MSQILADSITDSSGLGPSLLKYGFKVEAANQKVITLKAPDALSANYTLELPPSGTKLVAFDSDGTIKQPSNPYFSARHTTTETPGAGGIFTGWTAVTNRGSATFSGGRYTVPKTGAYLLHITLLRDTSTAAASGINLFKNGANVFRITYATSAAGYHPASGTHVLELVAGDIIDFRCELASVAWYGDATGLGSMNIVYLG